MLPSATRGMARLGYFPSHLGTALDPYGPEVLIPYFLKGMSMKTLTLPAYVELPNGMHVSSDRATYSEVVAAIRLTDDPVYRKSLRVLQRHLLDLASERQRATTH